MPTQHVVTFCLLDRTCKYGGEPEYWVETREEGEKGQELEVKRRRIETTEDPRMLGSYF